MAIHVFTGLPGAGKTVALVAKVLEILDEGELEVYPNFYIDHDSTKLKPWEKIEELVKLKQGVIVMDEIQIYLNSRFYGKLPAKLQYKLQQHRKQGIHIWGTVQNLNRVDVVMRELVTNYYECRKILKFPMFGVLYSISEYRPTEYDDENRKAVRRKYYWGRERDEEKPMSLPKNVKRAYGRYDTNREIEIPEDATVSQDETMSSATAQKRKKSRF